MRTPENPNPEMIAYEGPLYPGIFKNSELEHIITPQSEKPVKITRLQHGGDNGRIKMSLKLARAGVDLDPFADSVASNNGLTVLHAQPQNSNLVEISVRDLAIPTADNRLPTMSQVRQRAAYFDLFPCQPEQVFAHAATRPALENDQTLHYVMKPLPFINDTDQQQWHTLALHQEPQGSRLLHGEQALYRQSPVDRDTRFVFALRDQTPEARIPRLATSAVIWHVSQAARSLLDEVDSRLVVPREDEYHDIHGHRQLD